MGVAELFSGKGALSAALAKEGFQVTTFELQPLSGTSQPQFDLSHPRVVKQVCDLVKSGKLRYVHLGVPCSSFSVLRRVFGSGTRTPQRPLGQGTCPKEAYGNLLAKHSSLIISVCIQHGALWTLESPRSSMLFNLNCFKRILNHPSSKRVNFDFCMFGLVDPVSDLPYKKATTIVGNVRGLETLQRTCDRTHMHEVVMSGIHFEGHWQKRSVLAGRYPPEFCQLLASLVRTHLVDAHYSRLVRSKLQAGWMDDAVGGRKLDSRRLDQRPGGFGEVGSRCAGERPGGSRRGPCGALC